MYFETNKKTSSEYTLKEKNISIPIDIKTTNIKLTETKINIQYTVIDSNENYEYNIEMSE